MRPTTETGVRHVGGMGGERRAMGIDQSSLRHLMGVLTDLYNDPALATIREPATNADDAHRAVGKDEPIEVSLPSSINPVYIVRDRGIGMSVDDVLDILSLYGASTKRETDEEVGMLGLGAKAPLTYVSQFSLYTRKDGVGTNVLVSRGEDGVGAIEIVDTHAVDDDDTGTEVQIPVPERNVAAFRQKAIDFFVYWAEDRVLVDGAAPSEISSTSFRTLTDTVALEVNTPGNSYSYGQGVLVMGTVPYRFGIDALIGYGANPFGPRANPVVYAPMGAVDFAPNRESLSQTERTKAFVKFALMEAYGVAQEMAEESVASQETYVDAVRDTLLWRNSIGNRFVGEWQGRNIGRNIAVSDSWRYDLQRNRASRVNSVDTSSFLNDGFLWVHNHDTQTLSVSQRKKIHKYIEDNDLDVNSVFLFNEELDIPVDGVEWSEISSIKLPRQKRSRNDNGNGNNARYVTAWMPNRRSFSIREEDLDGYRLLVKQYDRDRVENYRNDLLELIDEPVMVVFVDLRSWNRFHRNHGDSIITDTDLLGFVTKTVDRIYGNLTSSQRSFAAALLTGPNSVSGAYWRSALLGRWGWSQRSQFWTDPDSLEGYDEILDERVATVRRVASSDYWVAQVHALDSILKHIPSYRVEDLFSGWYGQRAEEIFDGLLEDYPLLTGLSNGEVDSKASHMVDYLNAIHLYRL